jgi:hypothetical protein
MLGQLISVYRIGFLLFLLVGRWDISWVYYNTVDAQRLKLIMDPKTTIPCFINTLVGSVGKMLC